MTLETVIADAVEGATDTERARVAERLRQILRALPPDDAPGIRLSEALWRAADHLERHDRRPETRTP